MAPARATVEVRSCMSDFVDALLDPAPCAICGAAEARPLYRLPAGALVRCAGCGTVRRANIVHGEAAERLYDDDAYLEAPYFDVLKVGASRDQQPYPVYARVLSRLATIPGIQAGGRLLDVGCSYGAFLEMAAEEGWEPLGVELSSKGCEYARRHRGLDVFHGTLEAAHLSTGSVQAVTLWDVVEHLARPLETLREAHRVLSPGGTLMLFTINQRSLINRVGDLLYRASAGRWMKPIILLYDIHHNYFFDPRTIGALLERAGFELVEIDWMDADIDRWQNVPIPPLLALGSRVLDRAARMIGRPYRMIVFASKR